MKTSLYGKTYQFNDIRDVLAKANEPKSADRFQGIAAETVSERIAAKVVLSNLSVADITENPVIPPEKDNISRIILDSLNTTIYNEIKAKTIGELREMVLSHKYSGDALLRLSSGMCSEVIAGIAKLCSNMDLVYGASKIQVVTRCNTEIGQKGTLSYRCQPNHPSDDVDGILASLMEGLSFGCGDAVIGVNPVDDSEENLKIIMNAIHEFMLKWEIPTQTCVLGHVTTQMKAVRSGSPVSMIFQSIAGTQSANDEFGVTAEMLHEAYDLISHKGTARGPNLLYFETGQGSEVSLGADEGVDEMTLESRTYGFGRVFRPFMVNNVSGFIGPETLYDGREMIRANLEDHFMAKLHGLPMGMAPCYTNHTGIDQNDQETATMLLAMAGCNYYMGVPGADDVMLSYQDTSYQDDATLRELLCRTPAPEFFKWMQRMCLMDSNGVLTERGGDASVFM
ncbi:MAG: ethanolamine ammonia-lyase subunit EutB [Oscillospiraceae bacterium]|nr:ethanolamine ammonia-lyase subunit EutB [Oscillospiraceae bacterium]